MFTLGITKPRGIIDVIRREEKVEVPAVDVLYNFLSRHRIKIFGKSNVTLGDLLHWCEQSCNVPEDEDKAFVVAYEVFIDINELEQRPETYEDGDQFRIFVSTKRLICLTNSAQFIIQADGTYKLLWNGFPGD